MKEGSLLLLATGGLVLVVFADGGLVVPLTRSVVAIVMAMLVIMDMFSLKVILDAGKYPLPGPLKELQPIGGLQQRRKVMIVAKEKGEKIRKPTNLDELGKAVDNSQSNSEFRRIKVSPALASKDTKREISDPKGSPILQKYPQQNLGRLGDPTLRRQRQPL